MRNQPKKQPPKKVKEGPTKVKQPSDAPKVSYVYRKDAFNKVKLA
jgi:hypothetical protein